MRRLVAVSVIAAAILVLLACAALAARRVSDRSQPAVPQAVTRRPDIILITIDALRADRVSAYGWTRLTSPALDAFARDAVMFTNAIAQAPYTKASIASLMTGVYPSTHQTVTASVPFPEAMSGHVQTMPIASDVLPSRFVTIAEAMQEAGYRTIGMTTNPFLSASFGFDQGFDEFTFFAGQDFLPGNLLVEAALAAVAADRSRPLFLWVHFMEPHSPYVPPPLVHGMFPVAGSPKPIAADIAIPGWLVPGQPRDLRIYETAYDEEIATVDLDVDMLLRGLRGLRDPSRMVVLVTADHGEQFLDHGGWEHGSTLYDELIRVPLVVKAPGFRPRVVGTQVQLIDLYPTILAFAGDDLPGGPGRPLVDLMAGSARGERPALAEIVGTARAVRSHGWKVIVYNDGRQELFDLERDPRETVNRAGREGARLQALQQDFDRLVAAAHDGAAGPQTAPIDPAILQRLRALGYLSR
jgi:arylsulfatase A-like enzyme